MAEVISHYKNPPRPLAGTAVAAASPEGALIADSVWPGMRVVYEQIRNGPGRSGEVEIFAALDCNDLIGSSVRHGTRARLVTGWAWGWHGLDAWSLVEGKVGRKFPIMGEYLSAADWRDQFIDAAQELDEAEAAPTRPCCRVSRATVGRCGP